MAPWVLAVFMAALAGIHIVLVVVLAAICQLQARALKDLRRRVVRARDAAVDAHAFLLALQAYCQLAPGDVEKARQDVERWRQMEEQRS